MAPSASHVIMRGREALCLHCGAAVNLFPDGKPRPIDAVVAAVGAFTAEHAGCPANGRPAVEAKLEAERAAATVSPDAWIAGPDTGISSATIWHVMTGRVSARYAGIVGSPPLDAHDFGRCYRLLAAFPGWRFRLRDVAQRFPEWSALVRAWDQLTVLYEQALPTGDLSAVDAEITRLRVEARR